MCGICGIVSDDPLSDLDRSALGGMLDRLAHRGPDDEGRFDAPHAVLGHRRLAVIDLHGGRQPVANEDGTVQAVVNGELYNFPELRRLLSDAGHVLRSAGDSECLVHLYEDHGDDLLEHVSGMFAFAVWDEKRRRMLLARDRLGVKPLYYVHHGGRLLFASEIKALLAAPNVPREIDATALVDYLTYGFIPAPKTIFRRIRKLPAATCLIFERGRLRTRRYWDLHFRGRSDGSAEEIAEELWAHLREAARRRLVADVPLGAFLSGGLDSSAVVAAMASLAREPITTLACGFDETRFDERAAARFVAQRFQTRHQERVIRPDAAGIVDTLAWHFDEPFADASAIPLYYLSQTARSCATVMLSGDGGDESLAGYRRYRFDRYEQGVRRIVPGAIRRPLFGIAAALYPQTARLPQPLRAGATLRNLAADPATAHALSVSTLMPFEAKALLGPAFGMEAADYDPLERPRELYPECDAPDHLSRCQYVDIRFGLADGILTKVDRAGMAHGLEVRSPMLDYAFVEFAWTIPPALRLHGRAGKYALRIALERHVDPLIARRAKAGFDVPMDAWFRGPLRRRFEADVLHGDGVGDWLDQRAVERIWTDHLAGRRQHGATLWKLMMLQAWRRQFLVRDESSQLIRSSSARPPRTKTSSRPAAAPGAATVPA